MRHVVMFSGGAASWATAKRVAERYGTDDLTLLFADTNGEDADLYRFLAEGAANVGGELVILSNGGRTIWDVFREERFLGNTRVDPCSKKLKREPCDGWLEANRDPADTIVHVGISWDEAHRFTRLAAHRAKDGWRYEAPLCDAPYLTREDIFRWLRAEGIEPPRLYALGFSHNNCGGGCVKAGHAHWEHLLRALPTVFADWEAREEAFRQWIGRDDVAILRDRSGGESRPLTLREFRQRVEAGTWGIIDLFANESADGCGGTCFYDPETEEAA